MRVHSKQPRHLDKRKLRRKARRIYFVKGIFFTLIVELLLVLAMPFVIEGYRYYVPKIEEGHLTRTLSQIIKHLPDEPTDIKSVPYEAQIPKIVQDDIRRMRSNPEIENIVYQSEDGLSKLVIYVDNGVNTINAYNVDNPMHTNINGPIQADISFYRTEDGFIVYGRDNLENRRLCYYKINEEYVRDGLFYESSIDLFGVDTWSDEEYWNDNVSVWRENKDLTLVRQGNEFKFYNEGQECIQSDKSMKFPGGEITDCNYSYITDSNNDMYYMYYCADAETPWIHFEKVAESIDEVTDDYVELGYYGEARYKSIRYYTYLKNGKRYAAISDHETEMAYGQSEGKKRDRNGVLEPDYTVKTIEISKDNIREINLSRNDGLSSLIYVKSIYGDDLEVEIYEEHILRGIDTFIDVPEEELEPLLGTFKPEEYEKRIQAIKDLYQKYE